MMSVATEQQPLLQPLATQRTDEVPTSVTKDSSKSRHGVDDVFGEQHFLPKLAATIFNFVVSGISVTAVGALVPEYEKFYKIGDGTIGLLFPAGVAGYLCSTVSIQLVHLHLGRRGVAWISPILRFLPAVLLSFGPPFPLVLVSFVIYGFATGLTDSGWCAWATGMNYPNVVQGFLHGAYCVGCVLGPLIAVAVLKFEYAWYDFYRLIVMLACLELPLQAWAFRNDTAAIYQATVAIEDSDEDVKPSNPLRFLVTWVCGLFYFADVAIESTYSDWIVVYMLRIRHVKVAIAGFASSTFWIGMALGRIGLGPITERFGLRISVSCYLLFAVMFQILFKLVQNTRIALILLGCNGAMMAPTFPSGLLLLTTKLPKHFHVGAVAAAAAMGQIGGATVPLGIGIMAEKIGIERLLDVVLGLTTILLGIWLVFCRIR